MSYLDLANFVHTLDSTLMLAAPSSLALDGYKFLTTESHNYHRYYERVADVS